SFFFVRTCASSSLSADRLICLSMRIVYHILACFALCGVAFTFDLFTLLIGGAIVLAVLWVISTINGFKRREIKIEEALSGIEVALTKRYDMLTKLLDVCKGFMKHESDLFAKVISMRQGMSVGEMCEADKQMGELAGRLFAVAESYPELRT